MQTKNLKYDTVVQVMSRANEAGLSDIAFAVKTDPSQSFTTVKSNASRFFLAYSL